MLLYINLIFKGYIIIYIISNCYVKTIWHVHRMGGDTGIIKQMACDVDRQYNKTQ